MRRRLGVGLAAAALLLTGCGGSETPAPPVQTAPTSTPVPAEIEVSPSEPAPDPRQALALVPADSTEVTITDWVQIRDRMGYPGLDGDGLMSDRIAFWERARTEVPLLTDGLLREQGSRLFLDHEVTQADVLWEARFRTPDGPGYVLSFRRGFDMSRVRRAVADKSTGLTGGEVLVDQRLLVSGIADEGEAVLASVPGIVDLLDEGAESSYVRTSCVPSNEALGDEATVEDLDDLLAQQDIRHLRPLTAFAVNFDGPVATARMDTGRDDLHQRAGLVGIWPETGSINWGDGYRGMTVADPATGRIGLQLRNPTAAANLVLAGRIPFAVCNEVEPLDEPTGL